MYCKMIFLGAWAVGGNQRVTDLFNHPLNMIIYSIDTQLLICRCTIANTTQTK